MLPLSLVARLEEIAVARTESAGGAMVLAYRNRIMPLVRLDSLLGTRCEDSSQPEDIPQVIVFRNNGRYVAATGEQ